MTIIIMNKSRLFSILGIALIFAILHSQCEAANNVAQSLDHFKNQFLPPEYRNRNFTIDEVKKVLREKCKKASGVDNSTLYKEIEKGATAMVACLTNLTNITAIQEEIEKARPIGELDTVFHKYCTKAPAAEKCLRTFNDKIQPCLSVEERNQNSILMRVTSGLLSFMCSKGGDQIALFVAEEGPECLEANKEAISHCMNASFAEFIPKNSTLPDIFNLPDLVIDPKHCVDLERFEACALHHLEQCREITPANVVQSIFKFIKNETNCKGWMEAKANEKPILREFEQRSGNGASMSAVVGTVTVLLGTCVPLLLQKILDFH